jgi:uncharacterized protein (DUF302 family)
MNPISRTQHFKCPYMSFTFNKTLRMDFDQASQKVREALQSEGFGIITEIDLKDKFKEKLDVDFHRYTILGACNPKMAYEAVQQEEHIGVMLPCNVLLSEKQQGTIEVAAINPLASIGGTGNDKLKPIADQVGQKLQSALEKL